MEPKTCLLWAKYYTLEAEAYEDLRVKYLAADRIVMALSASLNRDESAKQAIKYRKAATSRVRRLFL
jgi:hypothetical protein